MNADLPFRSAVGPFRQALLHHPIYDDLRSLRHLAVFMEHHVYAVWDFMSLLKALQRQLTCVDVPWLPRGEGRFRRMVNEMVLGEESDLDPAGVAVSHFELYLMAMRQAGADTRPVETLLAEIEKGHCVEQALQTADCPRVVHEFVGHTFRLVETAQPHVIAAAFTYGREDLIPDLFGRFVSGLSTVFPEQVSVFRYYLDRHIQLDGDEHGELGRRLVVGLCGDHPQKVHEAREAAVAALAARLQLWDGIRSRLDRCNLT